MKKPGMGWAGCIATLAMPLVMQMAGSPALAADAKPAPLPAEAFVRLPDMHDVVLSPDGRRLAMLLGMPSGHNAAAVMDLDPVGKAHVVAQFKDGDVTRVRWVNNDRLVFWAEQPGYVIDWAGAGLFAVDHDGANQRRLISWVSHNEETGTYIRSRVLPYTWHFDSTIDDGSADVIISHEVVDGLGEPQGFDLARLNTLDGSHRSISAGHPPRVMNWLLDKQQHLRVVTTHGKGRTQVWWRKDEESPWAVLADFEDHSAEAFHPWLIDSDGTLLVTTHAGSDTSGLYKYDMAAHRVDPAPLVKLKDFDLHPVADTDSQTSRLVGVHFKAERPHTYWFDEELAKVQRGLDQALPGRTNEIYCGRCESSRFLVIRSSSDRQPGEYYVMDRKKATMQMIGAERPWIDEATQGRRTFHRVAARDGLSLPVYVTHPAGAAEAKALPMVLLVHGGPWVRGTTTEWEGEAQFLASRGYLVVEPEFRGSTGYGWKLYRASWKQWGQAMDNDLVDTVHWAVQQGLADPSRVCIMGASYGGYAALMGVANSPRLYRCAISEAGVTDLGLMRDVSWSDITRDYKEYGMRVLVGDPDHDAEMLARYSPLKRVADIQVPVLLVHGAGDQRVPVVHANEFAAAAKSAGVALQKVIYTDEGHGLYLPADEIDYLQRVEAFLKESMGTAP